ncbi:DUF2147 domain-containing protein [Solimonas variicoloris]|uniref:DUF2147 domain-containing protein n=1 Tax=Solimonas variicoloris TaxID=254408 RepID=UPI00036D8928|nr:DUF2147 domain-containing protein [Solimonas variicoloris]
MKAIPKPARAATVAALALGLTLAAGLVRAADPASPVGVWKTIDDKTGQAKSLVEIREQDGQLHGRVVKLFNPSKPNPTCEQCGGDRRGAPITGLEILWGLKKDGDEWRGGKVLDPQNGKVYDAKLALADQGRTLHLRGFIGFAMLGRSQTWLREAEPAP